MTEITQRQYWAEVESLAESITEDTLGELDGDTRAKVIEAGTLMDGGVASDALHDRLWETIDGHQWVMYTAYNFDVLRHSPNDDYAIDNWGKDSVVTESGMNWAALAFGALYADVLEHSDFGKVQTVKEEA